jgi:uncharacterized protein with PQ loop repeat
MLTFLSQVFTFENAAFVEVLGSLSALVEACLGVPQVVNNYKNKNTDTLSIVMILTWVLGDAFKSFYFYKTDAPLQLLIVGLTQLLVDFVLIGQIYYYNNIYKKLVVNKEQKVFMSPKSGEENHTLIESINEDKK